MPSISKHAAKRIVERCGIPKRGMNRMVNKAFYEGFTHAELTGQLKRWADMLYLQEKKANQMRLYGETMFLFGNYNLITVIPVPNNLKTSAHHQKKITDKD